jgi:hypothetical protein
LFFDGKSFFAMFPFNYPAATTIMETNASMTNHYGNGTSDNTVDSSNVDSNDNDNSELLSSDDDDNDNLVEHCYNSMIGCIPAVAKTVTLLIQEGCRKDVKRVFAILQNKFQI